MIWPAHRPCSPRSAAYQEQITGRTGEAYKVNGVKFDGYANGVLQEANPKTPATPSSSRMVSSDWFSGANALARQGRRQAQVANGTPIVWSVAEDPVVAAINNLFLENGISGIDVVYVPPGG